MRDQSAMAEVFASFLHILPYALGGLLCIVVLIGFFRGLTLPPHEEGHQPRRSIHWWYGPRD